MQVSVSGQHVDIGSSLQLHVKEKLIQIVQKYFGDIIHANIHFTKEPAYIMCTIELTDGTGKHIITKNQQSSSEIYASFDIAMVSLEKQLRKYKSRLKDRHERVKLSTVPASSAVKYVLDSNFNEEEEGDNPLIIAEKPVDIETLSVSEAVMVMDLKNLPALMFYNTKSGRVNTVYYRKDGHISWIDSK